MLKELIAKHGKQKINSLTKYPSILTLRQKKNKVKNLLQAMRLEGIINLKGKNWFLI